MKILEEEIARKEVCYLVRYQLLYLILPAASHGGYDEALSEGASVDDEYHPWIRYVASTESIRETRLEAGPFELAWATTEERK